MDKINKVLDGYGSFFALSHPASRILIFICAILNPCSGICGVLGAISVVFWRSVLQFKSETERIEIINGILLGSLMGSLYAINPASILLTFFGALLVVLFSAIFTDTIGKMLKLPLLGLPYSAVAFLVLPMASALHLPHSSLPVPHWLLVPCDAVLPLGAMYFNGTGLGGLLVLLAFCLSSRYLALLALAASVASSFFLYSIGLPTDSILALVARMNSVLSACIIGGLFAVPSKRSVAVSVGAAVFASGLTLALNNLLSNVGLPVLALPFVMVTYICMLVFNAQRGPAWTYFWLNVPALPETSLEQIQIAQSRGVDYRSIALKAPFKGSWQIYQGFNGSHTHKGNWQYALDFFQTDNNLSFINDGAELSDFHCFGKPVLSPAYGVVVDLQNNIKDNLAGEVDTLNNWGNYLLIRLDCGAHVILAHLQERSIKVQVGARVYPGEHLAAVGNSGRSPQPHLHMHVQESAYIGSRTIPFHINGIITHSKNQNNYSMKSCPSENDSVSVPALNMAMKRSLNLLVGNRFEFRTESSAGVIGVAKLEVTLDLAGQFWLLSENGAKVAFVVSDELLAFYNRQGPEDLLLDAFILAFNTTPLVEGVLAWQDVVPRRLLPASWITRLSHAILYPVSPCAKSSYKRRWDSGLKMWTQSAEHKIGCFKLQSSAHLCEAQGIVDFQLQKGDKILLKANLLGLGSKEDNGIPEWTASLPQPLLANLEQAAASASSSAAATEV